MQTPPDEPLTARLNAAAAVLWRADDVVQLELGHRRVVLERVSEADLLAVLPPRFGGSAEGRGSSGDRRGSSSDPRGRSGDRRGPSGDRGAIGSSSEVSAALAACGLLVSTPDETESDFGRERSLPGRLHLDLAALHAQFGAAAESVLKARREAAVAIHGASRIAASIASTLAAAGVGWVQIRHGGEVSAAHACPGGLTPADEGRRFGTAAIDAVRRAAPDVDTSPIPLDRKPDLVVLTDPGPVEPSVAANLHLEGHAHLAVAVDADHAVIGPLVVPGVTSCLRCADLHRTDRDPDWPALAVQLSARPRHRASADVTLCVAAAGVTAAQALSFLDHGFALARSTATVDGTLEWQLPDWRLRRRNWPPHPRCGCGASDD